MSLSFGSRIKLSLILALAWRPRLLILDEPLVGLDAISKQEVFSELLDAVSDGERSVLISSHNLADVERFADRLGLIEMAACSWRGPPRTSSIGTAWWTSSPLAIRIDVHPGVFVQHREANRWRVLLDLRQAPIDWLRQAGATQIADAPVTLEELFVAIGRERP